MLAEINHGIKRLYTSDNDGIGAWVLNNARAELVRVYILCLRLVIL